MITRNILETLITTETNAVKFEDFCRALWEKAEGVRTVPTSLTHDSGRDGRSTARTAGTIRDLLQVTLRGDLDAKVRSDLTAVRSERPERLVYCSSQRISEAKVVELEGQIRKIFPKTTPVVLGAQQLAEIAAKHFEIAEAFFATELQTIRERLLQPSQPGSQETSGLRLALLSFENDDAVALRADLSTRLVVDVLSHTGPATLEQVAAAIERGLGLPNPVSSLYVRKLLDRAIDLGIVEEHDPRYTLTTSGKLRAADIPTEAAEELVQGRAVIISTLKELTGISLSKQQSEQIWNILIDFLGHLFATKGMDIVQTIGELVGGGTVTARAKADFDELLREGAARVGAVLSVPDMRQELEQAVRDLFAEQQGPAFEWLSRVCERFLALTALGFEATSDDAVRAVLKNQLLVLDSDIVIALLSTSEPKHSTAKEVLLRWRQLGGRILVSTYVLSEVAHHAWISERDFLATKNLLGKLAADELGNIIENAFVRTYFAYENTDENWPDYISEFKGRSDEDYSKIQAILREDYTVEQLGDDYDPYLQNEIVDYILQEIAREKKVGKDELTREDEDKANRDGQLLASVAAARKRFSERTTGEVPTIVSSAALLRKASHKFNDAFGEPEPVITLGAVSYLISSIPGVQLASGTMRKALFEFGESMRLHDVGRVALRVIRASSRFKFPYSRRRTLQQRLRDRLHHDASSLGIRYGEAAEQFQTGGEDIKSSDIILDVLRDMAVKDKSEQVLEDAQRTISVLEDTVRDLQAQLTQLKTKSR